MRVVLIFPKSFEFFKALSWLLRSIDTVVLDIQQIDEYEYHIYFVYLPNGFNNAVRLEVLLIGDSDINFYGLFSKLVENSVDVSYVLVGSCGSNNKNDLGKLFVVTEAWKGDRGKLDLDCKFTFEKTKKTTRAHKLWPSELTGLSKRGVATRKACSTNFLNENVIHEDFAYKVNDTRKESDNFLFDMETYDFYDICEKKGVKMFSCIRFVTDYVASLQASAEDYGKLVASTPLYERWKDTASTSVDVVLKKKYVRLRLAVDFSPIFGTMNMQKNNVAMVPFNGKNIEKYYGHFYEEYTKKLSDLEIPGIGMPRETAACAENSAKYQQMLTDIQAQELQSMMPKIESVMGAMLSHAKK